MKPISAPSARPSQQSAGARLAPPYPNEGCKPPQRAADRGPRTTRRRPADHRCPPGRRPPFEPAVAELLTSIPFVRAIRGRLGEVVFKTYGRKIVVTRVPCFAGYEPSAAQRARRDRMREATVFAQRVYTDTAAKAFYTAAANKLGRQPFRLAVSDFLRGHPRVEAVAALCIHRDASRAAPLRIQPPRPPRPAPPPHRRRPARPLRHDVGAVRPANVAATRDRRCARRQIAAPPRPRRKPRKESPFPVPLLPAWSAMPGRLSRRWVS